MIPLISVILPVYNVEKYIKECMYSILNQTFQDFEILIIDDYSIDNTLNIIRSFNDKRIVIIRKEENKGLIDSLNIGFKAAKGKYIARVDGDDINSLDRFEKQLSFLQKNTNIKACGCWLQAFGRSDEIIKHKEFHDEILAEMIVTCPMSLGATMLEREAYSSYIFDSLKNHVEDYDFWSRTAFKNKLHNIQEVLYYYRVHDNQVSTVYNKAQKEGDIAIKLALFKHIKYNTEKYTDDFLKKVLYTNNFISINELIRFFKWVKVLKSKNNVTNVFHPVYLNKELNTINRRIVFNLFFVKNGREGINKLWRIKVLLVLPLEEKVFIINKKMKL